MAAGATSRLRLAPGRHWSGTLTAMTEPASPPRRWLYFSLRTLVVVVAILSVLLGWIGMQLRWIHDRREALRWLVDLRLRQVLAAGGGPVPTQKGTYISHAGIRAPWRLTVFGEVGVAQIEVDPDWLNPDAPYSLDDLRALFPEAEVKAATK